MGLFDLADNLGDSFCSLSLASSLAAGATGAVTVTETNGYSMANMANKGFLVLDPGTSSKEKIYYSARDTTAKTVTIATRGVGESSDIAHNSGAAIINAPIFEYLEQILSGPSTFTSPLWIGTIDGWIGANETWTYASATTITIPAGGASKYSKGDRIKLTQTTVKYFSVVTVADTLLTITGGTDYTLVNAAITSNYYAHGGNPVGWPGDFAASAPTFNVTTGMDNGSGGQPTTTRTRIAINGNLATLYWTGSGVKATTNNTIELTAYPSPTFAYTNFPGVGWVNAGSGDKTALIITSGTSIYIVTDANITDNATISGSSLLLTYPF